MGDDDYVELTGDDLPYHLRRDAKPLAACSSCRCQTWSADQVGVACEMPQPDRSICPGRFVAV